MKKLLQYIKRRRQHRKYDYVIQCEWVAYVGCIYVLYHKGKLLSNSRYLDEVKQDLEILQSGRVRFVEMMGDL